jgi:hypothetical protein
VGRVVSPAQSFATASSARGRGSRLRISRYGACPRTARPGQDLHGEWLGARAEAMHRPKDDGETYSRSPRHPRATLSTELRSPAARGHRTRCPLPDPVRLPRAHWPGPTRRCSRGGVGLDVLVIEVGHLASEPEPPKAIRLAPVPVLRRSSRRRPDAPPPHRAAGDGDRTRTSRSPSRA